MELGKALLTPPWLLAFNRDRRHDEYNPIAVGPNSTWRELDAEYEVGYAFAGTENLNTTCTTTLLLCPNYKYL